MIPIKLDILSITFSSSRPSKPSKELKSDLASPYLPSNLA